MRKKVLIPTLILGLTYSCGNGGRGRKPASSNNISSLLGQKSLSEGKIQGEQFDIALRICSALRSKKTTYLSRKVGTQYRFSVDNTNCSGIKTKTLIETVLTYSSQSQILQFLDNDASVDYLRSVQTHDHGQLANICPSILIQDTVNNTIDLGPQNKMQYNFGVSKEQLDYFQVLYSHQAGDKFLVDQVESYELYNGLNAPNDDMVGTVLSARSGIVCPDGKSTKELYQLLQID